MKHLIRRCPVTLMHRARILCCFENVSKTRHALTRSICSHKSVRKSFGDIFNAMRKCCPTGACLVFRLQHDVDSSLALLTRGRARPCHCGEFFHTMMDLWLDFDVAPPNHGGTMVVLRWNLDKNHAVHVHPFLIVPTFTC